MEKQRSSSKDTKQAPRKRSISSFTDTINALSSKSYYSILFVLLIGILYLQKHRLPDFSNIKNIVHQTSSSLFTALYDPDNSELETLTLDELLPSSLIPSDTLLIPTESRQQYNLQRSGYEFLMGATDPFVSYASRNSIPNPIKQHIADSRKKKWFYETHYDQLREVYDTYTESASDGEVIIPFAQLLAQVIIESSRGNPKNPDHAKYNNKLCIKHTGPGTPGVDYYIAADDSPDDRFIIFDSPQACYQHCLKHTLRHSRYQLGFQMLTSEEKKSLPTMLHSTWRALNIGDTNKDEIIRPGYATNPEYFDSIMKRYQERYEAFSIPSDVLFVSQLFGEETKRDEYLSKIPGYEALPNSPLIQARKVNFTRFVKKECGMLLPNGNSIYVIPHEYLSLFFPQSTFDQANLDSYTNTYTNSTPPGGKKAYRTLEQAYDQMDYMPVTIQQAKELIRSSHTDTASLSSNTIYFVQQPTHRSPDFSRNALRRRSLGVGGKRFTAIHGSVSGTVRGDSIVNPQGNAMKPLQQDLSLFNTAIGDHAITSPNPQKNNSFTFMVSKKGLIFCFQPIHLGHSTMNASRIKQSLGVNISKQGIAIECTQAGDKQASTSLEPLTPDQITTLQQLLPYLQYVTNSKNIITSADLVRNQRYLYSQQSPGFSRKAHTDDLTDQVRELLAMQTQRKAFEYRYQTTYGSENLIDKLYNQHYIPQDHHLTSLKQKERSKRYRDIKWTEKPFRSTQQVQELVNQYGEVLAFTLQSDASMMIYPKDFRTDTQRITHLQPGDQLYFEKPGFFERLFK